MATPDTLLVDPQSERDFDRGAAYPTSDGLALLGTSWHETAVHLGREALDRHFRGRDDVFIASLMALYYKRDERSQCLIPDLLVALGVPRHGRSVYKVWQERGRVPQFVLEVASRSTVDRDCGFKKREYEQAGVREYWQLDQSGGLLDEPLVGHRRRRGGFARLAPRRLVDGAFEYRSAELGLLLRAQRHDGGLRVVFRDPNSGRDILTGEDIDRTLQAAEERAIMEAERAKAAEERTIMEAERAKAAEAEQRRAVERAQEERQARLAAEERMARAEEAVRRALALAAERKLA